MQTPSTGTSVRSTEHWSTISVVQIIHAGNNEHSGIVKKKGDKNTNRRKIEPQLELLNDGPLLVAYPMVESHARSS